MARGQVAGHQPHPTARAGSSAGPSSHDATAVPSTWKVCASPASCSEPERSRASRDAVAMPMVMPSAADRLDQDERDDGAALHPRDVLGA